MKLELPILAASGSWMTAPAQLQTAAPVATLTTYIDEAIAGGPMVCFHFHDIGGAGDMSLANLTQVVEYAAGKARAGLLACLNIDQFYRLNAGAVRLPKVI